VVRSSALRTGRLYSQEFSWYSFLEAESSPGHMVPSVASENSPVTPLGIDPETSRLVAQCLNHYATPVPVLHVSTETFDTVDTVSCRLDARIRELHFLDSTNHAAPCHAAVSLNSLSSNTILLPFLTGSLQRGGS
jgi:hypothetical protein